MKPSQQEADYAGQQGAPSQDEILMELMGMGSMGDRQSLLERQMAMAQALRQPSGEQHSTPLGALFGGLGDVAGGVAGAAQGKQLRGQQEGLLDQQDAARRRVGEMLARRQQAASAVGGIQPAEPVQVGGEGIQPAELVRADAGAAKPAPPAPVAESQAVRRAREAARRLNPGDMGDPLAGSGVPRVPYGFGG